MKTSALLCFLLLALPVSAVVHAQDASQPQLTSTVSAVQRVTVLSYNIHHAEGVDGRLDLDRIAAVIRTSQADVVALQEVDQRVTRSNNIDQPQELAERLGMHVAFGPNIDLQGGKYGNAVLSRFPIKSTTNHLLPNVGGGEQRGLLEVDVELLTIKLTFLATHFDHRRNPAQRMASATFVNELVTNASRTARAWQATSTQFQIAPPSRPSDSGRFLPVKINPRSPWASPKENRLYPAQSSFAERRYQRPRGRVHECSLRRWLRIIDPSCRYWNLRKAPTTTPMCCSSLSTT